MEVKKIMRGSVNYKILILLVTILLLLGGLSSIYAVSILDNTLDNFKKNVDKYYNESYYESINNKDSIKCKPFLSRYPHLRSNIDDGSTYLKNGLPHRRSLTIDGKDWSVVVPDDYSSIQAAVDAVSPEMGYRIFVRSGTYNENIIIDIDGVTLHGENRENTIIDGGNDGDVLTLKSNYNNISGFTIKNSGSDNTGIYFNISSGNILFDCKIMSYKGNGLWLFRSHANTIYNNLIKDNAGHGVLLNFSCLANTFSGNDIRDNNLAGIFMDEVSRNNIIVENHIDSNDIGVKITGLSENNMIHHNKFISNVMNGFDNSENIWDDNIKEGNYWDNYNGTDSDGDGIGDNPYQIAGGCNQDRFPLVSLPFTHLFSIDNIYYNHDFKDCSNHKRILSYSSDDIIIVPDDYLSIQKAIDHANDGDTIKVRNGIYYENIIVNKSVFILGDGMETTIVDGNNCSHNIYNILADNVQISGFTIQHTNMGSAGINIKSNNCKIENNIFQYCGDGIHLFYSNGSIIYNNFVIDNNFGIYLDNSNNCEILSNVLNGNGDGICLWMSKDLEIVDNFMNNNSYTGNLLLWAKDINFTKNDIKFNNNTGFQGFNIINISIIKNAIINNNKGISVFKSSENQFNENLFINNGNEHLINNTEYLSGYGFTLRYLSNNNIIMGNYFLNNMNISLGIINSGHNKVMNNSINYEIYGDFGIVLDSAIENQIYGNTILGSDIGIILLSSKYNTISKNKLFNDCVGIYIEESQNNILLQNEFFNCEWGVWFFTNCINNNILFNDFNNNYIGISIYLTSFNKIMYNNFFNQQTIDVEIIKNPIYFLFLYIRGADFGYDLKTMVNMALCSNFFYGNYWNFPMILPKIIPKYNFDYSKSFSFSIDLNPALSPNFIDDKFFGDGYK
jgi:parallel beta-helix repeat protein